MTSEKFLLNLSPNGGQSDDGAESKVKPEESQPKHQHVDSSKPNVEGGKEPDNGSDKSKHASTLPQELANIDLLFEALANAIDGFYVNTIDRLTSLEHQAAAMRGVERLIAQLNDVKDELVSRLVKQDFGSWVSTEAGTLKRDHKGGSVQWDHEMLWPLAIEQARKRRFNPETGEVVMGEMEALLSVLKEAMSPGYWRNTALAKWNIDPAEYKSTAPKRKIVKFVD